ASALPRTGGIFVFLREGWGRLPAFLFGWSELVIIRASALGAISTVFAEYLLRLMAVESAGARRFVAAGAILLVALFNILGVQLGTLVQNLTTWAKYLALVGLVVAAFLIGANRPAPATEVDREAAQKADAVSGPALTTADIDGLLVIGATPERVKELVEARGVSFVATPEIESEIRAAGGDDSLIEALRRKAPQGTALLMLFGLAFISLLWVYDGWADLTFMSGEVKRPERVLPLALIIGTLAVIGIYLLANFAYLHLLTMDQIASSRLVAATAAYRMLGDVGVTLISIAVMISAFGTLNGSMMTGPRIFFAMADDGLFFKKIASVHPRFKTPYVAISLAALLAILFVLVRTFEQLADTFVLAIWPFYAAGVAAVYALRRKRPDLPRPYRTLGYPITPALFIIAVAILIGNALINDLGNLGNYRLLFSGGAPPSDWSAALLVFSIILLGIPAYFVWKATHSRRD
ncbi:MAG TPA: amino acid permease, partial [Blastocatellia bacterium]|nr:amino acid permease [Blastocatellia bacterium]